MASFDDRLNKLCARLAATPGKQVVVVEGTGDVAFFTIMLDKPPFREKNLFARYLLVEAGGKDAVLKMLAARPDFMAIVDRDTWSDAECEKLMRTYPGLRILPRFCIENYIICPDELSAVFAEIDGNVIARHIPEGIRHACLWRAAQPLYDALMRAGFHRALMAYPPPSDTQLDGMIKSWQSILSASSVAQQMQEALNSANTQQPEVLLRTFVHGKVFWRGVVEQHMERLFPREDGEELKRRVYRALPVPQDLKDFMQQIFKTPE